MVCPRVDSTTLEQCINSLIYKFYADFICYKGLWNRYYVYSLSYRQLNYFFIINNSNVIDANIIFNRYNDIFNIFKYRYKSSVSFKEN